MSKTVRSTTGRRVRIREVARTRTRVRVAAPRSRFYQDGEDFWCEVPFVGWLARYRLVPYKGQPVIAELRLLPAADTAIGVGLTARLLRRVPLGAHRRHAVEFVAAFAEPDTALTSALKDLGFSAPPAASHRARGGRSDSELARIAYAYVGRILGGSRKPVAELAKSLRTSAPRVRDLIHAARIRGLLDAGRQGTPGGALTPKAMRLLKGERS